jgi:gamma-glutamyltranspeptidase/glutathione hydrolase
MSRSNDRPMLMSTHTMITSGHYLATAAGQRIALQGGNAVDIAAAVGFCLGVLEPHDNTCGGEVPTLVYSAAERKIFAISGVGWTPKAFTIDWCRQNGIDLIPGDGYLPACVPASVGTWALALQRFGTLSLAQVLQPAIELAEGGFPVYPKLQRVVAAHAEFFKKHYPSTAEVYLPGGRLLQIGEIFRNPDLANTFKKLCQAEASQAQYGRVAAIQAGRDAFYKGEIAETIHNFIRQNPVEDASGMNHVGLLAYEDLAEWEATLEEPLSYHYHGLDVYKCPAWTQGPVFLQQLAILDGIDLPGMGLNSPEYLHTLIEAGKLAFADREAYYGDPRFDPAPFDVLLSPQYNAGRRALIESSASLELRPGNIGHTLEYDTADVRADNRRALGMSPQPLGTNTVKGDTTHLDVIDRQGNMVSATPSGAWISSSPLIRGLGFPLGTRAQMFFLNPARPNALAGHKRPRATLTPSLVTRAGEPYMVFGMRGGDMQDQKTLQFFLAFTHFDMNIQQALDNPNFHSAHFPDSFYPRHADPGCVIIEERFGAQVLAELERRGHKLVIVNATYENLMGIQRDPVSGVLCGGVCSTGEHAYGLGW